MSPLKSTSAKESLKDRGMFRNIDARDHQVFPMHKFSARSQRLLEEESKGERLEGMSLPMHKFRMEARKKNKKTKTKRKPHQQTILYMRQLPPETQLKQLQKESRKSPTWWLPVRKARTTPGRTEPAGRCFHYRSELPLTSCLAAAPAPLWVRLSALQSCSEIPTAAVLAVPVCCSGLTEPRSKQRYTETAARAPGLAQVFDAGPLSQVLKHL